MAQAMTDKRFGDVEAMFKAVAARETALKHKVPKAKLKEIVENRIEKFVRFLEWHARTIPAAYGGTKQVSHRRLLSIGEILSDPKMSPFQMKMGIRSALWDPAHPQDDDLRNARTAEVWKLLGIQADMPGDSDRADEHEGDTTPWNGIVSDCSDVITSLPSNGKNGKIRGR